MVPSATDVASQADFEAYFRARGSFLQALRVGQVSAVIRSLPDYLTSLTPAYFDQLVNNVAEEAKKAAWSLRQVRAAGRELAHARLSAKHEWQLSHAILTNVDGDVASGVARFPVTGVTAIGAMSHGCVKKIKATASEVDGPSEVIPVGWLAEAAHKEAVRTAGFAALHYARAREQSPRQFEITVESDQIKAGSSFNDESHSYGLAVAVAVLSDLLAHPIYPSMAFTGDLDLHGTLTPETGGIPEKLAAAGDFGIDAFWMGLKQAASATALATQIRVRAASNLETVADELFGWLARGRGRFTEDGDRIAERHNEWIAEVVQRARRRVLFAVAGPNDPQEKVSEHMRADGPVLFVTGRLKPDLVVLFVWPDNEAFSNEVARSTGRRMTLRQAVIAPGSVDVQEHVDRIQDVVDDCKRSEPTDYFVMSPANWTTSGTTSVAAAAWRRAIDLEVFSGTLLEVDAPLNSGSRLVTPIELHAQVN